MIAIDLAYAHVQGPLRELELRDVVVEIQNRDARIGAETRRGRADLQLGVRARVRPHAVAADERAVDLRHGPILFACRREADRSADLTQAGDSSRWIGQRAAA